MNTSYIFLAPGFEEIEALTVLDVMRRAGMDVKTVSITDERNVAGAHGVTVTADLLYSETDFITPEWLILPGGMPGATNLSEFAPLNTLLVNQAQSGKIAAICASPGVVLGPLGILDGKEATCYPGFEKLMPYAIHRDTQVIALDRIITANGPSAALRFALAIVANSMGESVAQEVGSGMLFYPKSMNFYF
ncbi:MAG: DJ-1/PfpI family protein [Muribaculaceae bacterium]|nr:DJ-1/PfpI family protein [Muribaculaceae bacterium]